METEPLIKVIWANKIEKLISAVQARECIWDKSDRGHMNRLKLERYWNEVAEEVGTTSLNCRKRWRSLKDKCRKEVKKNPIDSDWPHFQKLNFIHNQFLEDDDGQGGNDATDEDFGALDDSIKTPEQGYTMRKKLLMNKRRTIDVDVNKLIELVQARDIIWNNQLEGRHNWYKLNESWREVALELDVTSEEARSKWKYLRDNARKEVRKFDSEWQFLPKLQFLTNQFNDYEGNVKDDHMSQEYDADQSTSYQQYNIEPTPEGIKYNIINNVDTSAKDDEFDTIPVTLETHFYDDDDATKSVSNGNELGDPDGVTKDEDVGFFNSLLPYVRKLGPEEKLMLRMKIQELVYNMVYS